MRWYVGDPATERVGYRVLHDTWRCHATRLSGQGLLGDRADRSAHAPWRLEVGTPARRRLGRLRRARRQGCEDVGIPGWGYLFEFNRPGPVLDADVPPMAGNQVTVGIRVAADKGAPHVRRQHDRGVRCFICLRQRLDAEPRHGKDAPRCAQGVERIGGRAHDGRYLGAPHREQEEAEETSTEL
jgi:hypothetical protein